jgi:hypothetical protein
LCTREASSPHAAALCTPPPSALSRGAALAARSAARRAHLGLACLELLCTCSSLLSLTEGFWALPLHACFLALALSAAAHPLTHIHARGRATCPSLHASEQRSGWSWSCSRSRGPAQEEQRRRTRRRCGAACPRCTARERRAGQAHGLCACSALAGRRGMRRRAPQERALRHQRAVECARLERAAWQRHALRAAQHGAAPPRRWAEAAGGRGLLQPQLLEPHSASRCLNPLLTILTTLLSSSLRLLLLGASHIAPTLVARAVVASPPRARPPSPRRARPLLGQHSSCALHSPAAATAAQLAAEHTFEQHRLPRASAAPSSHETDAPTTFCAAPRLTLRSPPPRLGHCAPA